MNAVSQKKTLVIDTGKNAVKVIPAFNVEELLNGFREVRLRHCSEEYRLILTKNNKLILTK